MERRLIEALEAAANEACRLAARPEVAAAWTGPSVLEGFSVGAVVAHLHGGLRLLERALEAPPEPGWRTVGLADFFGANRVADRAELHGGFHAAIRDHAARAASVGADDVTLPAAAVDVATEVLVALARARSGDAAVIRAFTRAERAGHDVLRVL